MKRASVPVAAFPASRRPRAFSWQESMRVQGEAEIRQPKVSMIEKAYICEKMFPILQKNNCFEQRKHYKLHICQ